MRSSCRLTWPLSPASVRSPSSNNGNRRRPTRTCWCSGTGRRSSTIVVVPPRTSVSHAPNSSALETVADKRDDGHRLGQPDDDLLPDGAAEPVGEVVHLVHDDEPEAGERARPGIQHVAEHLGGHHDHRCLAVDGVVAGQQADVLGAVPRHEVGELLVRQGLDRCGVEALAPGGEGEVDGELADDGLAGAGGRGDQDAVTVLDGLAGLDLERVERKWVQTAEFCEVRMDPVGAGSGVPLGRGGHASSVPALCADAQERGTSIRNAPDRTVDVIGSGPSRSPSP